MILKMMCWSGGGQLCVTLTCNDPSRYVELGDGLGEWAGSHSKPTQDPTQNDCRPAAKPLHQHATKRTCR